VVLLRPEGDGPAPVYPAHLAVTSRGSGLERDYRFGGDLGQVRVRAAVMTLDLLRRALGAESA
jgi:hypothetical protein